MLRPFLMSIGNVGLIVAGVVFSLSTIAWGAPPAGVEASFELDPLAVTRHGPGWRIPQHGWIVVHIEGTPYERGYQHGRLLAREIVDYGNSIAKLRNEDTPEDAWQDLRLFTNALFLRRIDNEILKEMQGIADGAAAAGAKFDGRLIDLIDILVINIDIELGFLESALEGTSTGLDGEKFRGRHGSPTRATKHDRCSAFMATGPATADGKIVAGHITMSDLASVPYFNVWLDIQPSDGHRCAFQTYPGGIQSGLDYYINSAGLILMETTIQQTKFNSQGETIASRIRRAVQYANSIDRCVEILSSSNNGLYTNEWLIGDIKTNEIAMFELGTEKSKLWRSSRNEWVAGTTGFYWGCNNAKDAEILKDTVADMRGKPVNLVVHPRLRDQAWLKLFQKDKGQIDEAFGFKAFSTPPIVAFPSCDAKFTTASMAKNLKTWAMYGPPLGRVWKPTQKELDENSFLIPLVPNDWTLIDVMNVKLPVIDGVKDLHHVVDLEMFPKKGDKLHVEFDAKHPFAWRGTLLPKTDADIWLAAAFAEYEKVISLQNALAFHEQLPESKSAHSSSSDDSDEDDTSHKSTRDGLSLEARDLINLALFQHNSRWLTSVRRTGRDLPLTETKPEFTSSDWYRIAEGKGVMLLAALRKQIGAESFDHLLDQFGQKFAGQEMTTEQFRSHLKSEASDDAVKTLDRWLKEPIADKVGSQNPWTIFSYEVEPEQLLIVYGTLSEHAIQREAAEHLQSEIIRRFANVRPPIRSDVDVTDEELKSNHLLLIGHRYTNRISALCEEKSPRFPVRFGPQSFVVDGETYANPESWIIASGDNPYSTKHSAVLFSGLNANSTWKSVHNLVEPELPNPQIILTAAGKRPRMFCITEKAKEKE